jgi:hypothetical protein
MEQIHSKIRLVNGRRDMHLRESLERWLCMHRWTHSSDKSLAFSNPGFCETFHHAAYVGNLYKCNPKSNSASP